LDSYSDLDAEIELESLAGQLALRDIYENVDLEESDAA
jgi:hypothetical protein